MIGRYARVEQLSPDLQHKESWMTYRKWDVSKDDDTTGWQLALVQARRGVFSQFR